MDHLEALSIFPKGRKLEKDITPAYETSLYEVCSSGDLHRFSWDGHQNMVVCLISVVYLFGIHHIFIFDFFLLGKTFGHVDEWKTPQKLLRNN